MRRFLNLREQILANRVLQNTAGEGGGAVPAPIADPAAAFARLLEKKNGDGVQLASQLFDENFQYREKIRNLLAAQPAEGSRVLNPDEAKEYEKISGILSAAQLDSKGLKTMLDKVPELEKTAKELASMENLRELADIGLGNSKLKVSVLKDLMQKYPDAEFRFATEKDKDGTEVKNAYIKPSKEGQETTFSDFAEQNLSDYLPALKVTAEQAAPLNGNGPDPAPAGGSGNSFFDGIRKQVEEQNKAAASTVVNPLSRFGRSEAAR